MPSKGTFFALLAEKIQGYLAFNKRGLAENRATGSFLRVDYDDPLDNPSVDFPATLARVAAFRPHIVIAIGALEVHAKVLPALEAARPSAEPGTEYVLNSGAFDPRAVTHLAPNDDLRKRVTGVAGDFPAATRPVREAFRLRYEASYTEAFDGTEPFYDGVYAMLFAMTSVARGRPINGARIAEGMGALSGGTAVNVGPTDLDKAFNALSLGESLTVTGISAIVSFNRAGDIPGSPATWCVSRANGVGPPTMTLGNGLAWDRGAASFRGVLDCP